MRTRSSTRANYSPVRRMGRNSQDRTQEPSIDLQANNISSSPMQYHSRAQSPELENTLEEVYICSCCGISSELSPGIKFMSTFKSLFFLFNLLVLAFGLANFGMGLWFRIDPKIYEIHKYIETQNFTIAGWIMLFCGFLTCIVALTGFMAAGRQVAGLLVCYFTVMIALTLALVGTLVMLTIYGLGRPLESFIVKEIYEQIRRRSMSTEPSLFLNSNAAQFLDFIQVKMRCCGAEDFRDYTKLGMVVPTTCYSIDKNFISAPGCGHAIRQLLDLRAGLATGFTSASVVVQLVTIILSALMFCSIYHWRAHPRPATPQSLRPSTPIDNNHPNNQQHSTNNMMQESSSWNPKNNYHQPRSRTPIFI